CVSSLRIPPDRPTLRPREALAPRSRHAGWGTRVHLLPVSVRPYRFCQTAIDGEPRWRAKRDAVTTTGQRQAMPRIPMYRQLSIVGVPTDLPDRSVRLHAEANRPGPAQDQRIALQTPIGDLRQRGKHVIVPTHALRFALTLGLVAGRNR